MTGGPQLVLAALVAVAALARVPARTLASPPAGLLIKDGLVVDGSGATARRADVRVVDDTVVAVAPRLRPEPGDRVLSAAGRVVAPGFIDLHNHSDRRLFAEPDAATQVRQGITTVLVGLDGESPDPVAAFLARLEREPSALNVATLVGHGTLRRRVLGADYRRRARPREVAAMAARVARAMEEGAFGLSSGLEYDPGYFAGTAELVALAREAGARGGFYATHLRDEGEGVLDALAEAVDTGRRAGVAVHVSHLKLGAPCLWGRAAEALALLHDAARELDVSAECYPYPYWATSTRGLLPPGDGGGPRAWRRAVDAVGGPGRLLIARFPGRRAYEGLTLEELAGRRGEDPTRLLEQIARAGHADVLAEGMDERDVETLLRDSLVAVASDGGIRVSHPRGAGTFPRVLGRYVRERRLLTLEAAVHKMSGLPARRLGLDDRGLLEPGRKADLVVFDPEAVLDCARPLSPRAAPAGVEHVLVNGVAVVWYGEPTGARPGRALRREGAGSGE